MEDGERKLVYSEISTAPYLLMLVDFFTPSIFVLGIIYFFYFFGVAVLYSSKVTK